MNDPVKILEGEHEHLMQAIAIAKRVQAIDDNKTYYELLHDILLFLRNYTEIYHYPKEENMLYPLLRNYANKFDEHFMFEIRDNHEDFKSLIAQIENDYLMYDYFHLRKNMDTYLDSLAAHLKREDKIILGAVKKILSEIELETIYNEFIRLDGNGKEELQKQLYKIILQVI